mmetsp:Transcript_79443/g.92864  ORF Transcript_79443/g.92864 Transcript_79443/m.92864 type:complete len:257 (+) Transcript_79443:70-840(+)
MCEVTGDGDYVVGRPRPKNNPLIRRSEVGKAATNHDLPALPPGYTFGAPLKRDPEGAGEVMLSWQAHATPAHKKQYDFGRDFITLNKQSLKAGCILPEDVAEFRKTHEARIKPKTQKSAAGAATTGGAVVEGGDQDGGRRSRMSGVPEAIRMDKQHVFGAPSPDSEHVADLIQNRYELEWVLEQKARHEAIQAAERELKLKQQRSHSPTAFVKRATPSPTPHPKEYFTMKQFTNVPSRFFTPTPTLPDIRSPSPAV